MFLLYRSSRSSRGNTQRRISPRPNSLTHTRNRDIIEFRHKTDQPAVQKPSCLQDPWLHREFPCGLQREYYLNVKYVECLSNHVIVTCRGVLNTFVSCELYLIEINIFFISPVGGLKSDATTWQLCSACTATQTAGNFLKVPEKEFDRAF